MPVDRKALATALTDQSKTVHYIVDRQTGSVLKLDLQDPKSVAGIQQKMVSDKARYVQIPKITGRGNIEEMERFMAQLQDPHLKAKLARTMASHAPAREFRDVLQTNPKEWRAWEKFHQETTDKRVAEFLRGNNLS